MSEPLLVKAMEWSDTKLKQKEAAQDKCLIKAVPDKFPKLLEKSLCFGDDIEHKESIHGIGPDQASSLCTWQWTASVRPSVRTGSVCPSDLNPSLIL